MNFDDLKTPINQRMLDRVSEMAEAFEKAEVPVDIDSIIALHLLTGMLMGKVIYSERAPTPDEIKGIKQRSSVTILAGLALALQDIKLMEDLAKTMGVDVDDLRDKYSGVKSLVEDDFFPKE